MKQKKQPVLDGSDEKIVELFMELGMPKNLAKTLLYVSQVEECKSADVERGANLRQPEVSIAMQELRRRGWATKRDVKKKGKGRPVHVYRLTTPLSEIIKQLEEEKMKEVNAIKENLEHLKQLIQKYDRSR
ncbi:MAG: ArsR family transcriptional regulator [Thermoplasmata archaeon]|nr:MAG: ArsR family transcriptional regulator [Thermoplasmata archaeon]